MSQINIPDAIENLEKAQTIALKWLQALHRSVLVKSTHNAVRWKTLRQVFWGTTRKKYKDFLDPSHFDQLDRIIKDIVDYLVHIGKCKQLLDQYAKNPSPELQTELVRTSNELECMKSDFEIKIKEFLDATKLNPSMLDQ